MLFGKKTLDLLDPADTLPGRDTPIARQEPHAVLGTPIVPPFPEGHREFVVGMGCFWGSERIYWQLPGVHTTAVGYSGGVTPNPTYQEVCSGRTNHAEDVLVVYDPEVISFEELLVPFWENHDPTTPMRQGNDVGTQYRSAVYYTDDDQKRVAEQALQDYDAALQERGFPPVTTEIAAAGPYYFAEEYHQQYLHKVPNGYCGLKGTGVTCAIPS